MKNISNFNTKHHGRQMFKLMKKLYPICRSITGSGVRETLRIIKKDIPLKIREIPSGTKVFDWVIPPEWNIREAYIKGPKGKKIVDFKELNLHVVNYSTPVRKKMLLEELKKHIFTIPEYPDRVPYVTSYYKKDWGFCMSHRQCERLGKGTYEVVIDSTLKKGSLTYGEYYIKGRKKDEVLFSCYICHPSLCNDNLSGAVLLSSLARLIMNADLKYSYRFLFIPETIGAIAWLSRNEDKISRIKHGLVATCVGDPGHLTYKKSRDAGARINKIVEKVLKDTAKTHKIIDFFPYGSDERQFCSPDFNMPIGVLMRTPYGRFSEYHTSADNLEFVKPKYLADSLKKYYDVVCHLENDTIYLSTNPRCEPQLDKRKLFYKGLDSRRWRDPNELKTLLWVINLSDGENSLVDISVRSGIKFDRIKKAADLLLENGLLKLAEKSKNR